MPLADAPALLMLLGLTAYTVLAGADFGTGVWVLTARGDSRAMKLRDYAHNAMGPVWEANHVWLIFVIVVFHTGYPVAFGSVMSTLAIPLFVAVVGIILRGSAYALRAATWGPFERGFVDNLFALSSILTPFALGATIGGIASGRVPVGNAAGDLVTSWLNPTSIIIGAIAVGASAHLAALYLAADATRAKQTELVLAFRTRALLSGVVTGVLALAGLAVVSADAPHLFSGLRQGAGLAAVVVSGLAGVLTLLLVDARRYEAARYSGGVAVVAIVSGWAAAQQPDIIPGLPVTAAAASQSTVITILVVVGLGGLVLVPSFAILFGLFLRGTFDPVARRQPAPPRPTGNRLSNAPAVVLVILFIAGTVLAVFADAGWAVALGIAALLIFVAGGFFWLAGVMAGENPPP